ncbi:IclR family transcriptional regulator [Halobacterium sp. CBA1126]|uniref:IclR family transcriptional regulator n=1 Tax=Halobacterium TaxID=2239 RepID=UPI0012F92832|nr:IclR family transcriptional regulator [Halobacterium sp. CBA1126]MUV59684.1 helix-turn-helix domain-containing protein [Halobacterium sp. CBA1126]
MPNEPTSRTGVKSDETLFAVLSALRDADGAGVTELADRLDVAKSTVHNHLATMREHGFVVKRDGEYHLGLALFEYGQSVRNGHDVYRAARPVVDDLVETTGEMVWLLTPENGRVMYLYGGAGETGIDVDTILGSWDYMHCTAGGKAILAHYAEDEVDAVVDRHGLPARTPNTVTDREELASELETVRERGYALNLGEDLEGIHALAVPLRYEDELVGSLAVAGPAHRVSRERCETDLLEALRASTNDIELNLAYA